MPDRDELVDSFMSRVSRRNEGESEFLHAVRDVAEDILTIEKNDGDLAAARVLERLTEPDRTITFRVTWMDDSGAVRINRGWRVQMSNAIGPYKGGLRFHSSVTPSILKFLAFEQVFKNALTGLPLGGAKGGSDFDPTGRSDAEIMRFCDAFMAELVRYIGPDVDIPAGDINVGQREIGYLFGAYKKAKGAFEGALTGKGVSFGGSEMRIEATGYGLVYFVSAMLDEIGETLEGKRVLVSGKGNVATHAAEKAVCDGATVLTLSDTSGTLYSRDGFDEDAIDWVRGQKRSGAAISNPPKRFGLEFKPDTPPWGIDADIALPCATQNEIDASNARKIAESPVSLLAEGANMPLTADAADVIGGAGIIYAPGKASNAGGVAISGLEMSQDAHRRFASADEIDGELKKIMQDIHARVAKEGRQGGQIDYRRGANIAGYRKVAAAIAALGMAA